MLSYIVCFIIITLIASAIAQIFKKKIDVMIPISVMIITLIIYPFGFFYKLNIGVITVCIFTIFCLGYLIFKFVKSIINKTVKEFFARIITPGLLVYALFWGVFIYINSKRMLTSWDEFSHWGLIVKNMYQFKSYGTNPETIVAFKGYPPFTAIFEYFFLQIRRAFVEGEIIVAMNVLYVSMVLPIMQKIGWKKDLYKLLIYVPVIFAMPLCLYQSFYTTIYVDMILGIFMAYILYCYFTIDNEKLKYISIALGIISLTLIKTAGTGIAVLTLLIILADMIFQKKLYKLEKKKIKKFILIFFILVLCLIIGKESWSIHLKLTNTKEAWHTSEINLANIFRLLTGNGEDYQYTVIQNFLNKFFTVPLNINIGTLPNFHLLLIYILFSMFTLYLIKKFNENDENLYKRHKLSIVMLIICYIIYLLSLLVLYIFTYSEYEAVRLASYDRYSFIFLIGMFVYNIIIIMNYIQFKKCYKASIMAFITILILIMPYTSIENLLINTKTKIENTILTRTNYSDIINYKKLIKTSDKIYYVSCGSTGFDFHVSRYNMVPYKIAYAIEKASWSLGKPRSDGDIWSYNISTKRWNEILIEQDFQYVYIYEADDIFKETYGKLFKNKNKIANRTMYKVNVNNGKVKLSEMPQL